jgi:hypothetical protein
MPARFVVDEQKIAACDSRCRSSPKQVEQPEYV